MSDFVTIFFNHVDQLPSLIRHDFPSSVLKIKTYWLTGARKGAMRSARVFVRHEPEPPRYLACVIKPNIARIVAYIEEELRALRQWMIPYVISMTQKLRLGYLNTAMGDSRILPGTVAAMQPPRAHAAPTPLRAFSLPRLRRARSIVLR